MTSARSRMGSLARGPLRSLARAVARPLGLTRGGRLRTRLVHVMSVPIKQLIETETGGMRPISELRESLSEIQRSVIETDQCLREHVTDLEPVIEDLTAAVRHLIERSAPVPDTVARVDALIPRLDDLSTRLDDLISQLQAVPYVAGIPFVERQTPVGLTLGYRRATGEQPTTGAKDSAYAGFEDRFRGPADRVSELQRPYLKLVTGPVLDIGCGRGEFLHLLAGAGITASGVDADPGMVARCRAAGFEVSLGDGIEHLRGLADASLGAIFCAQVIEHLPVTVLEELLALAVRKLRPDGRFIAETVNPHSLAGMKTFWVDLTHQHPIFPEVALALCELTGFAEAYVFAPGFGDFGAAMFRSNSYAVVAQVTSGDA